MSREKIGPLALKEILRKLMYDRGLSPREVAKSAGISYRPIYSILSGKTTRPRSKTIKALADYFQITPSQLLGETPLPPKLTKHLELPEMFAVATKKQLFDTYINDGWITIYVGPAELLSERGAEELYCLILKMYIVRTRELYGDTEEVRQLEKLINYVCNLGNETGP